MITEEAIFKLQLITFFNSLSFGLLYSFLAPHLIHIGGDQLIIGIFAASTLIASLISPFIVSDILRAQGRKATLYTIFNLSAFCNALLIVTSSYCFIIMVRCVWALFQQPTGLIKSWLEHHVNHLEDNKKEYHMKIFNIMAVSGFILGPIITGSLFDISFSISCVLASFCEITNVWLLITIPDPSTDYPSEPSNVHVLKRIRLSLQQKIEDLQQSQYEINWDILVVRYLFVASFLTFSQKYSQILKHSFHCDYVAIGYTTSYMNIILYISIYCSETIVNRWGDRYPLKLSIFAMFSILLLCLIIACLTSYYTVYMIICIPIFFSKTLLVNLLENWLKLKDCPVLNKVYEIPFVGAGLTAPIIFGILCYIFGSGYKAIVILSLVPIGGVMAILNFHSLKNDIKNFKED